jgi:hypothetical protein
VFAWISSKIATTIGKKKKKKRRTESSHIRGYSICHLFHPHTFNNNNNSHQKNRLNYTYITCLFIELYIFALTWHFVDFHVKCVKIKRQQAPRKTILIQIQNNNNNKKKNKRKQQQV